MTGWTVVWLPDVENELTQLWLDSTDRAERERITLAANQIDELLRHAPETAGESRATNRRILIVPPLAVIYRVSSDDRLVQISNVREIGPRPA